MELLYGAICPRGRVRERKHKGLLKNCDFSIMRGMIANFIVKFYTLKCDRQRKCIQLLATYGDINDTQEAEKDRTTRERTLNSNP